MFKIIPDIPPNILLLILSTSVNRNDSPDALKFLQWPLLWLHQKMWMAQHLKQTQIRPFLTPPLLPPRQTTSSCALDYDDGLRVEPGLLPTSLPCICSHHRVTVIHLRNKPDHNPLLPKTFQEFAFWRDSAKALWCPGKCDIILSNFLFLWSWPSPLPSFLGIFLLFLSFFKTGSHYVALTVLKLCIDQDGQNPIEIHRLLPPKRWNQRCVPLCKCLGIF